MKIKFFIIEMILSSLLLGNKILAQNNKDLDLIFENQIRFSFSPILYSSLEINNTGKDLLKSYPTPNGELSISYHKYISDYFSMNIGVGIISTSYNIHFFSQTPTNSIFYNPNISQEQNTFQLNNYSYSSEMLVFPFSIQKIIKRKKNFYYSLELGLKWNKLLRFPYKRHLQISSIPKTDTNFISIFKIPKDTLFRYEIYDTGKKNILSYFFKLGLIKLVKNQNTLHLNFVVNFAFDKIGKGWYRFYNLPFESYGTVEHNINYIGFEFLYAFTLSRRKSPS